MPPFALLVNSFEAIITKQFMSISTALPPL